MKKQLCFFPLLVTCLLINFSAVAIPTLGTYSSMVVKTGFDTIALPNAIPSGTVSLLVTTSSSFTGILTADPVTGAVRIINPKPTGNYLVTINAGSSVTQSFSLTVVNPSCSQATFTGPTNFSMGTNPYHVAVGDFNNDGFQDVITSNYGSANISIRLGNGLGGFSNPTNYSTGANTIASAVGDLNGDGNEDIVVANWGASNFTVRLGDGTGAFGSAYSFSTSTNPSSVVIGDFNNDGYPDIACANAGANTVSIRLGNGTGTSFTGSTNVSVGTTPRTVVIGDFNNDGNQDIATSNYGSGNISVRLGNGAGGFTGTTTLIAGTNPFGLAVGDFNGDGIQDLVATNYSSPDISIRIGDGTGNFINTANTITASNLSSVAVCDLNSDGIQDLVCGRSISGSLAFRYGIGNGTFSSTSIINVGTPYFSTVGDFNSDGRQDIVSSDYSGNQMSVLFATDNIFQLTSNGFNILNGNNVYSTSNNTDFGNVYQGNLLLKSYSLKNMSPFTNTINSIIVSGLNASEYSINGVVLPATINSGASISFNIQFAPNATGNQFANIQINQNNCPLSGFNFNIRGAGINQNIPLIGNYSDTFIVAGGNLTITPDTAPSNTSPVSVSAPPEFEGIITIDPLTGEIKILNAKPSGDYSITLSSGTLALKTFLLHVTNPVCSPGMFNQGITYSGTISPYGVTIGDFNSDGIQDIAGTGYIKLGTGHGNFGPTTNIYMGPNPLAVAIGDFNNDGRQDIVAGNNNSNALCIRLGNGSGGFLDTITLTAGSFSYGVVAADFNNDGITDIATVNYAANTVTVLAGFQSGSYITVATVNVGAGPVSIVTGDFNNDGYIDFATANKTGSNVSIRLGNGLGNFSGTSNITVGVNPSSIAKADFNKDGNSDLVVSNSGANTISVLTGDGFGGFINNITLNLAVPPVAVTTGDFNGDGYADIAAAQNNQKIYFIAGDSTGGFAGNTTASIGFNVISLAVGDFNGDNREDILSTNSGSSGISILMGNDSGAIVTGLLNYIVNGQTNVNSNDNTDYSIVPVGNSLSHTFSIYNPGIAPLTISNMNIGGINSGEFSITGIALPFTITGGGNSNFNVVFSPTSAGIKNAVVQFEYAHCATKNYNFVVQGQGLLQSLGTYKDTSVVAGGNISLFPDTAPTGLTNLNAKVVGNFSGILNVNPLTGKIQITNAKPAGIYTVQLFATGFLIRSFILTVRNPDCSSGYFENASDLLMGTTHPVAVGVCDLNNDNIQDLISVSYQSNNFSVLLGDGLGGFSGNTSYTAGTYPQAIVFADFNGDGNQDVALANNTGNVSIRFGDGTGGFPGLLTSITVGTNPQSLAAGDFNNDGKIDLLVANYGSSTVSLLTGDGLGAFTLSNINVSSPRSVIAADFNNDGIQDFACALYQSSGVGIFLGDNQGGFVNAATVTTGALPTSIASGDFNQDGNADIVAVNSTTAYVLQGNGLGGFTVTSSLSLTAGSNYVVTGDFDGDGKEDIAVTNSNTASFTVWLGNQSGGFTNSSIYTSGAGPASIVVGDFNADKKEDLAIANNTANTISVRLGSDNSFSVTGNANNISNGSTSVSVLQNTDFGSVAVNSGLLKTYTIQNRGAATVTINNINITGVNFSNFTLPGISFPLSIQGNSNLTFNVLYSPLVTGISNANVDINFTTCTTFDFVYAISGTGYIYTPGVYPTTTLIAGGNSTVIPSLPPGGTTSLSAYASSGFTGVLFADPSTGNVNIINAKPAGNYSVTVTTNTSQVQTFSLIVNNPSCSQATFSASSYSIANANKCVIGDFNNDGNQDIAVTCSGSNSIAIRLGDGSGGISGTTNVSAGTSPDFIVTGDFNNDGKLDLACTNSNSPNIIICLGDGFGGFTTLAPLVLTGTCSSIATGDFNSDGNMDIAVANSTSNTVLIRLGNGTGYFSGTTDVSVGSSPRVVVVCDFNNDGKLDFAVTNYSSGTVSIRMGNGNGGFSGTTNLTGGSNPFGIASADINNDGNQDLIFSNYGSASASVELGNGTGNFTAQATVSVGSSPIALYIADFNGDGFQDFITSNQNTSISSLRLGNGSGTFTSNVNTNIIVPFSIGTLLTGDFNNDGKFDLVTVNSGGTISILKNLDKGVQLTGKGIIIADSNLVYSSANNTDFGITVVGLSRLLTYNFTNNGATPTIINSISFTGINANEFSISGITFPLTIPAGGNTSFNILFNPASVGIINVTANINYNYCNNTNYTFSLQGTGINIITDNYPNVTVTEGGNKSVIPAVVPQNSGGLFVTSSSRFTGVITIDPLTGKVYISNAKPAGVYTVTITSNSQIHSFILTVLNPICSPGTFSTTNSLSSSSNPYASAIGDFNNDGKQDLAIAVSSSIKIYLGDGLGGFTNTSNVTVGSQPNSIAVSDFNDDGIQDLATTNFFSNSVSICKGNGSGGFTVISTISTTSTPTWVTTGDFNEDGKNDLAIAVLGSNKVLIRLGDGLGGFTAAADISSNTPRNVVVGDFNNDNKQDLAITNYSSNTVSIKLGDGLGGFSGSTTMTSTSAPYAIVAGDFNSDGNVDLASSNNASSSISVFLGNGSGGFSTQTQYGTGAGPNSISVGDFNGDSYQDLAISNQGSNTVSIRFGNGLGSFSGSTNVIVGTNPYSIVAGDFNTDGVMDLAAANFNSNSVSILTGTNTGGLFLTGNGNNISNGSNIISGANNTDFGFITMNNPVTKNFVIQNTSSSSCVITSTIISGVNSSAFSISGIILPVTIAAGDSANFNVMFTPDSNEVYKEIIHLGYNICVTSDFSFAIQGFGTFNCNINISDNNVCTVDACDSLTGISHTPVSLDDRNACTVDACDPGTGISHTPVNTDDNNACTVDACDPGTGVSHSLINTDDNNVCTTDGCDPVSGPFHYLVNFNDSNACTIDGCDPLNGISHTPVNVDDSIAFTQDGCDSITGIFHNEVYSLKLFIEGYYTGNGLMDNFGEGGCLFITHNTLDSSVCDSVQLTLMDSVTHLPVQSSNGLLHTNGLAQFNFNSVVPGDYYLMVRQRNSIETWSAVPVSLVTSNYYDFTASSTQAFGNNMAETFDNLGWAFYSGDISDSLSRVGMQDGIIDLEDYSAMYNAVFYTYLGYEVEDLNGDGIVESGDYSIMENNVYYTVIVMHP